MSELKDIRPLYELSDYWLPLSMSLLAFLLLICLVIVLVIVVRKSLKKDIRKLKALKALETIDFQDAKATAYSFTKYASVLLNHQDESQQKQFEILNQALESYKYKASVAPIDELLIKNLKLFIENLKNS